VILRPETETDLAEARSWYERQREGLGDEFLESVENAFGKIDRMPEMHRLIYRDIRRIQTQRFPFTVYYRIVEDEVVVVAVLHSRRDPRIWQARLD
jgi:plasmid stabilization system protein ParE